MGGMLFIMLFIIKAKIFLNILYKGILNILRELDVRKNTLDG